MIRKSSTFLLLYGLSFLAFAQGPLLAEDLPQSYFQDIYHSPHPGKTVILLQDAGKDPSHQLGIAKSLAKLLKQETEIIYQEGATGDASLSPLRHLASPQAREKIAETYLNEGLILGSEYQSLVAETEVVIGGLEDPVLYMKMLKQYNLMKENWSQLLPFLNKLENSLAVLRPQLGSMDQEGVNAIAEKVKSLRDFLSLEGSSTDFNRLKRDWSRKNILDTRDFLRTTVEEGKFVGVMLPEFPENELKIALQDAQHFYLLQSELNRVFVRRFLDEMDAKGKNKAIVVATSLRIWNLKAHLKKKDISYSVLAAAGRMEPGGMAESDMDRRPLRTALGYDLAYDSEPGIWKLSRDLGNNCEKSVETLAALVKPETLAIVHSTGAEAIELSWLRNAVRGEACRSSLFSQLDSPGPRDPSRDKQIEAADFLFQKTFETIEEQYNQSRYEAFKRFVDDRGQPIPKTKIEELNMIEKKLRGYEKALSSASALHQEKGLQASEDVIAPNMFFNFMAGRVKPFVSQILYAGTEAHAGQPLQFRPDPVTLQKTVDFMAHNLTREGLPLGYLAPPGYWEEYKPLMDDIDSVMERLLVSYGISIYDAALWQIALTSQNDPSVLPIVNNYTHRLLSGKSGDLEDIRAYGPIFAYGTRKKIMKKENAYFFRIIADQYVQEDPLTNTRLMRHFPNFEFLHHEDWKPITGEQAWAAIIGPLQVAHLKYHGNIRLTTPEVKLALSVLPAVEAMTSEIGGIYHAPSGTHHKNPNDISNENNFSMYVALKMLNGVLKDKSPLVSARIRKILKGQEEYFKRYVFDPEDRVFYQGGFYADGKFVPMKIFAADCQTWGILAMGPAWIDKYFGEGAAYGIWKNTKERAGYFNSDGVLEGIGFTDGHKVLSIEWTAGAILAVSSLVLEYKDSHPRWARELELDIISMRQAIEKYKMPLKDGSIAYLYANKRYFIPFGWWTNPIPSLASSAWIVMIDTGFNPFILGGGPNYNNTASLWPPYYSVTVPAPAPLKQAPPFSLRHTRIKMLELRQALPLIQKILSPAPVPGLEPAWYLIARRFNPMTAESSFSPTFKFFSRTQEFFKRPAGMPSQMMAASTGTRLFQGQIEEEPLPQNTSDSLRLDIKPLLAVAALIFLAIAVFIFRKKR